ncbi:hypothetical protein ACIBTV_11340 [Micromonospora sp. NPDC049366]|uniref:hypothetical protein n=1 Tax=Micromonospora sp. NPDC049366 TaxID=3364271 RepID=UPI00379DB0DE
MAKKMLGKVVAGAALGGASLLVFTPGIAFADGHHDGKDRDGKVIAKPHVVKAGEEVKLLEICSEKQEHAFVWSKVTGKVDLKPVKGDRGDERGDWREGDENSYDRDGKDEHGKDDKGKDEHGKDWNGKDDKGKDEHGKDDKGKDEHGKDQNGKDENGEQSYGQGGGAADSGKGEDRKDWQGYEHGQDAEDRGGDKGDKGDKKDEKGHDENGSWDSKDREYGSEENGSDWKSDKDSKGHDEKGSDEYGSDENGSWDSKDRENGWEGEESGDYGKGEDGWEHKRDFVYYGEAKVDKHAKPGKYELKGSCGEGELIVLPHGGVDAGDGGMTGGTDRGLAAGGASLLGAAALGGIVLMRRRRTDESLV